MFFEVLFPMHYNKMIKLLMVFVSSQTDNCLYDNVITLFLCDN